MVAMTDPNEIALYRLVVLRAALRLELKGLRRNGPSALTILKREKLVQSRTRKEAIEELSVIIDNMGSTRRMQ